MYLNQKASERVNHSPPKSILICDTGCELSDNGKTNRQDGDEYFMYDGPE